MRKVSKKANIICDEPYCNKKAVIVVGETALCWEHYESLREMI